MKGLSRFNPAFLATAMLAWLGLRAHAPRGHRGPAESFEPMPCRADGPHKSHAHHSKKVARNRRRYQLAFESRRRNRT